jgi:N-acetylmuramoyl-L-alanine amidase
MTPPQSSAADGSAMPDCPLATAVVPSPHHEARRTEERPDILLLHYTGMATGAAALAWLCDPRSKVSCHYFVDEDGAITQLVPEARRAWHAGLAVWQDDADVNSRSIGVEIVNPGHEFGYRAFPDRQIAAVIALARDICARLAIPPERVLAHSDVAPRRKQDPGELFPWGRLAEAGVGHWVEPAPITAAPPLAEIGTGEADEAIESLQMMLSLYGYGIEITGLLDAQTSAVVTAFQRHFRQARVDGVADPSTLETLRRLLAALPERQS